MKRKMTSRQKLKSGLNFIFYIMLIEAPSLIMNMWHISYQVFSNIYTKKTKTRGWTVIVMFSIGLNLLYFILILLPNRQSQTSVAEQQKYLPKYNISFKKLTLELNEYKTTHSKVLRKKLFPWLLRSNLSYYHGEKNSKGIVICTGNRHFNEVIVAIKSLEVIHNDLPIEVMYSTSDDLSLENQETFREIFPHIPLVDLSRKAYNDIYLKLRGWEAKPYAILASRFEKVILMDADVLFFNKPSILFEHKYFIQTGTLFFHDRPKLAKNEIQWIKKFLLNNNQPLPTRQQESGVVVIDKSRVFDGLLSICKLNDYKERVDITYRQLYGDKDTFWLGLHLMNIPYAFVPTMPAVIGRFVKKTKKQLVVCGQMLHFDEHQKLLWSNGGILDNRFTSGKNLTKIDGWLEEGTWTFKVDWCMLNKDQKPRRFNEDQQRLINEYRRIVKNVFDLT